MSSAPTSAHAAGSATPDFESVSCARSVAATNTEVVIPSKRDPGERVDLALVFRSSGDEPLQDQAVRCEGCGLVYVRPRLKWEHILEGYQGAEDPQFVAQASFRERTFERCLLRAEKAATPPGQRVLDVGTAGGSFLHVAAKHGYEPFGCEPSAWMCRFAKEHYGLTLHPGTLFDAPFEEGSFDLVTLWDVLEHTPDPKAVLERAHALLAPEGVLALTYPDYGSLAARLLGCEVAVPADRASLLLHSRDDEGPAARGPAFRPSRTAPTSRRSRWATWPSARSPISGLSETSSSGPSGRFTSADCRSTTGWGRRWWSRRNDDMSDKQKVVILGGGVAGLAAGHYLARDGHAVTVVEQAPRVGGLCASFESHGFTLDFGPHKMYSVVPGVLDELRAVMGDGLIEHEKKNRIRLLGRYLNYPLSLTNLLPLLGPLRSAKMGLDFANALAAKVVHREPPASYEDYVLRRFGRSVYELVFEPLAWKVWGDPKELSWELAAARIPSGGATELVLRLLKLRGNTPDVDAPFFYYPKGGFGAFPEKLASNLRGFGGTIRTSTRVESFESEKGRVKSIDVVSEGERSTLPCDLVVSSIPIQALAQLLHPGDEALREDARGLKFRQLALVYLILDSDRLFEDHWIFFPEKKFPFNRLFEQKAMSPDLGPPGTTAVCCDITCELDDEVWKATDEDLAKRCYRALVGADLVKEGRMKDSFVKRFRDFYPVYSKDYRERLGRVYERLGSAENLILTGRLGMFNYNNSDHCLDMGRFIAERLSVGRAPREIWTELEARVRNYRIVD